MKEIGIVKIDIHRAEYQFKDVSFSDVECIKTLIRNRHMVDPYLGSKVNRNIFEAGDVAPVNQELICVYVDLENLLNRCKLTQKQEYIIHKLTNGYTEEEVAKTLKQEVRRVSDILNTIAEKIKELNYYDWKYNFIYMSHKRVIWDYKKCSKCDESKPITSEFFSINNSSKDGHHSICKDCK